MAYNRKEMIRAIYQAGGVIEQAARILGCAPLTIYRNAEKYATVQNAIDEARYVFAGRLLDEAEIKLMEAVKEGKAWAVRYVLDSKGKVRGYDPHAKHEFDTNVTVRVSIGDPDSAENADS